MKINFDEATHTYTTTGGKVVPSVTQVLKKVGFGPQGDFKSKAMTAGADRGVELHDVFNSHVLFGSATCSEDKQGYYDAFLKFLQENKIEFESGEYRTVKEVCGILIAGTIDLKALVNGIRSIIDFKTTKTIEKYHAYQLAIYKHLDEEEVPKGYILQVMPNGQYVFMEDETIAPGCTKAVERIIESYKKEEKFSDSYELAETADVKRYTELEKQIKLLTDEQDKIAKKIKSSISGTINSNKFLTITYKRPTIKNVFTEELFIESIEDSKMYEGKEIKKMIASNHKIEVGKSGSYAISLTKEKVEE